MERVGDLAGVGQRHVEGAPIGAGAVQHPPVDALAPRLGLREQPRGGARQRRDQGQGRATGPAARRQSRCTSSGCAKGRCARTGSHRGRAPPPRRPVRCRGEQRFAPGEHRPVRRVPVTTQLGGHIGDRAGVAAHRHSRPASRPRRQRRAGRRDLLIDLGERADITARRRQRQRHLCHMRRTGRPNAGRSTNSPQRRLWTTPPHRSPHTAAVPESGCAAPTARRARRRRRGPPHRRDRRSTRRYA